MPILPSWLQISPTGTMESGDLHSVGVSRRLPPLEIREEQTGDPEEDPAEERTEAPGIAGAAKPPEVSVVSLQGETNSVTPEDSMEQILPEDSMDQLRPSTPSTDDKMVDLDPPHRESSQSEGHVESWLAAEQNRRSLEALDATNFLKNISPKTARAGSSRMVLKRSQAVADINGQAQVTRETSAIRYRHLKVTISVSVSSTASASLICSLRRRWSVPVALLYCSSAESHILFCPLRPQTALQSRSLYMFEPESKFRLLCYGMISSPYFELAVMIVILANCLALALYIPNKPDHILTKVRA